MQETQGGPSLDLSAVPLVLEAGCGFLAPGGRRVLADVEGRGVLTALASDQPVLARVDDGAERPVSAGELRGGALAFRESLTLSADTVPEGFAARVDLWCDPEPWPCEAEPFEAAWGGEFETEGAGWWRLSGIPEGGRVLAWIGGLATPVVVPAALCGVPMPFAGGLRLSGPPAEGARVAGWRSAGWTWVETDRVDPCDEASREAHGWAGQNETAILRLESRFDPSSAIVAGTHRGHLNGASFDVTVDNATPRVRLRRTFDRFHGVQRARVLVDGAFVGIWRSYTEDRTCRWAEDDFPLPPAATRGRDRVRVTIDPMPGTALWDAARYRVLCARCR